MYIAVFGRLLKMKTDLQLAEVTARKTSSALGPLYFLNNQLWARHFPLAALTVDWSEVSKLNTCGRKLVIPAQA